MKGLFFPAWPLEASTIETVCLIEFSDSGFSATVNESDLFCGRERPGIALQSARASILVWGRRLLWFAAEGELMTRFGCKETIVVRKIAWTAVLIDLILPH